MFPIRGAHPSFLGSEASCCVLGDPGHWRGPEEGTIFGRLSQDIPGTLEPEKNDGV